jgi:hypothetical protein
MTMYFISLNLHLVERIDYSLRPVFIYRLTDIYRAHEVSVIHDPHVL